MDRVEKAKYLVAVIGAGPAGFFAAKHLASQDAHVLLVNRDIKPGGLAEYGIYPEKIKIKDALRAQFSQILALPEVDYFGNIKVGEIGDISLEDLRWFGAQAILVATGAQGTKWLGLPGEGLEGVYHAKDLVFHYNQLPPYNQQSFSIGNRVVIVGVGNVMLDIVRWLADVRQVQEITAVARRGPAEVKFDKKELELVVSTLDRAALAAEMDRITPVMQTLGQDPGQIISLVEAACKNAIPLATPSRLKLAFLASPRAILEENGKISGVEVEENTLCLEDGVIKARSLGIRRILPADTVIFAIGDSVDSELGLPIAGFEYLKNPQPCFPIDNVSYEVYDPQTRMAVEGLFVAGWARQASTGVVGLARKDGINCAKALLQYLRVLEPVDPERIEKARQFILNFKPTVITTEDLALLRGAEEAQARARGMAWFNFPTNEEMLATIGKSG